MTDVEVKHTPGPWSVGRTLLTSTTRRWSQSEWQRSNEIEERLVFARFSSEDEGRSRILIAECQEPPDERMANARLIAAAPELLEAIRDCMKLIEDKYDFDVDSDTGKRARAAIAKAEGK